MRLFVCSDIHMAVANLDRLLEKVTLSPPPPSRGRRKGSPAEASGSHQVDAILFAGDLTNWGSRADALTVLSHFQSKPVYTIPGNLDTPAVMEVLEDQTELVHGRAAKLGDWTVVGFGGGSLNNPGEILFSEETILESMKPLLKNCEGRKTLLLTHQPPANTKLDLVRGEHVGSQAVRALIEKYQPAFQFCGHIHESWDEDKIGNTRCYNVAAVKEGRAAVLDLKILTFKRLSF